MTFDSRSRYCPLLHGKRLTLEPLTAAHAEALFPILNDEELWRYTDARPPESVDALRKRYRLLEARRSVDGTQLWLNWAVASPEHGIVGFVQATVPEKLWEAEVAYVITSRFWSLGLGTEAVGALLTFLRTQLQVRNVHATVDSRNVASLRLLEKLGFRITNKSDERNVRLDLMKCAKDDLCDRPSTAGEGPQ